MGSIRLPRFRRSPEVPSMRLTERDRELLKQVQRHRFLRSNHFTSLLPGSKQQIRRRLQLLYHHGFLERPRCQIEYYHRGGSRAIVYGLGNKGVGLLKRELSLPFHRLDWPRKNRVERYFLEHALLVSDFMVALELSCRSRTDLRLLTEADLDVNNESIITRNPLRWCVKLPSGPTCTVIPDRVFGFEFADGNRTWFVLEADRATMPVIRSKMDQSSFFRKALAYQTTWAQNLHRDHFGWRRFRVLTITTDSARLATMQEACRGFKSGHGLFLFGQAKDIIRDVLKEQWLTAYGESESLLS